jgi:LmbE family N-acetylglucosaminyl deacetylase
MKLTAPLALALYLTLPLATFAQQATAPASTAPFTDPANLRGERVSPSDGHELPIDQGASGLQQLLRKLNTRASLLLITAHPDDEDGGMLTLYSRGLGARVATLTLNRGEGGQNFVTPDFEDALGLIRTQELLSADRYFDTDQMFGTEVDFGFSKTKEESFQKWTHERVLYDAVRTIRLYRPLVIAAVFVGGVTDGHGQHQVSGEIAQEAFKAAADPTVFPDMIREGILPWQALKVYARVPMQSISAKGLYDYATNQYTPARFTNYVTGQVTTTVPSVDVVVHEGTPDPLLTDPTTNQPRSYIQFARIGLSLQRTQIGGNMRLPGPGPHDVSYHLYGSALNTAISNAPTARPTITAQGNAVGVQARRSMRAESPIDNANLTTQPSFFDGIDTSIEGIATLAPSAPPFLQYQLARLAQEIEAATRAFDPQNPARVAPSLRDALQTTDALIGLTSSTTWDSSEQNNVLHELRIKHAQLNDALVLALGLHLDATAPSNNLVENTTPAIKTSLSKSSPASVILHHLSIDGALPYQRQILMAPAAQQLTDAKPLDQDDQVPADLTTEITQPYFYRDNIEQPVYKLRDPALRNAPQTPAPLTAWATVTYQGAEITLGRIVHSGPQPVSIVPPVSIASAPEATVLPNGQTTAQLTTTLSTDATTSANVNVQSPRNWSIQAKAVPASAADTTHSIHFFLHPTAPISGPQLFHVTAQTPDHHAYSEGYRAVGYPGLIYTNDYAPATTRVVPVDLKLPEHLRIAYLPGTGDTIPEALASIGLAPTPITVADLTPANLANFDTVILGVRAYTAHSDLHGAPTQTLLDFARNGGNVLVQYQTSDFSSADTPYPLSLGDAEKVVDETDPVQLLAPSNPLLTTPNPITSADFDNWIEERGHGFLDTWDSHYIALTEVQDPGGPETAPQLPQRGALITAPVGKGRWTYCAYALYRQLPEAVPGAFRLFVNLLTPTR